MKKTVMGAFLFLIIFILILNGKKLNIIAGLGVNFAGDTGVTVDLGTEFRLKNQFFLQVVLNSIVAEQQPMMYYDPHGSFLQVSGITLLGIYKLPVSSKVRLFCKAGLLAKLRICMLEYFSPYMGMAGHEKRGGIGSSMGLGIEKVLSKKVTLFVGTDYQVLFKSKQYPKIELVSENYKIYRMYDWLKIYMGVIFRFKVLPRY